MPAAKDKTTPNKGGRPPKYQPKYCGMLVEHLRRGYTFTAFGAVAGVGKQTLFNWVARHKAFREAKELGEPLSEMFYLKMGHSLATGQLRRLKSEEPVLGADGQPVMDPTRPGELLMRREYEHVSGSAPTWIFMMKNMHRWRDRQDLNHGGQEDNPVRHEVVTMSAEERTRRIKRLEELRKATDP